MTNKTNFKVAALAVMFMSVVFTSCKKDEDETPPASTEQALSFHLHTVVGSAVANYTSTFTDATGRKLTISDLRYYISNIVLIKEDGSELPLSGKVLLVNPANQDYALATVPVGNYKGFKFYLGLDSVTNHSDPTTYASGNPLAIQTPSIHWSWNSGYIFMKFEGMVDTTLASNGTPNFEYFYHVGLDSYKRSIDFSNEAFSVVSGSDKELELDFDVQEVLNGVDMRTENATHTMDNMPLATKIANNWSAAFSIM